MADRPSITLGSASPRRLTLLRQLGIDGRVEVVDIDEQAAAEHLTGRLSDGAEMAELVSAVAAAKFAAFEGPETDLLLTADTMVFFGGAALGKPTSDRMLEESLGAMSGNEIAVVSAVCVGPRGGAPAIRTETTRVRFRSLTPDEVKSYVAGGAGRDKAGGLALQGEARPFMRAVHGCWSNVIGLPQCRTSELLGNAPGAPLGGRSKLNADRCPHLRGELPGPGATAAG